MHIPSLSRPLSLSFFLSYKKMAKGAVCSVCSMCSVCSVCNTLCSICSVPCLQRGVHEHVSLQCVVRLRRHQSDAPSSPCNWQRTVAEADIHWMQVRSSEGAVASVTFVKGRTYPATLYSCKLQYVSYIN